MIKLYLLPICWQSMEEEAFHFNLSNLSIRECKRSFEFVMPKDLPPLIFGIIAIATNGKPSSQAELEDPHIPLVDSLPMATVVVFPASSKVNLPNDDT